MALLLYLFVAFRFHLQLLPNNNSKQFSSLDILCVYPLNGVWCVRAYSHIFIPNHYHFDKMCVCASVPHLIRTEIKYSIVNNGNCNEVDLFLVFIGNSNKLKMNICVEFNSRAFHMHRLWFSLSVCLFRRCRGDRVHFVDECPYVVWTNGKQIALIIRRSFFFVWLYRTTINFSTCIWLLSNRL